MNPHIDYHALAPEIVVIATITVVLLVDLFGGPAGRSMAARIAAVGVPVALFPGIALAAGDDRFSMFNGAYVVDNYALAFKGFFIVMTYITLLLSFDYIEEGDYHEGEYYLLLLTSLLGLMVRVWPENVTCDVSFTEIVRATVPLLL